MPSTDADEVREDDAGFDSPPEEHPDRTPARGPAADEVRAAKNEALLREYNERIEAHHKWVGSTLPEWACECANKKCPETVLLSIEEYEAVRAESTHFLVAPHGEHVDLGIERVVQREERYWVVEKVGIGAAIGEALDPRSP